MAEQLGRAIVEDYLALADDSAVAILPHALRVFVILGLPEALNAPGELPTVKETAERVGAHPQALGRLLAALAAAEVVAPAGADRFELTELGRRLLPGGDARASAGNAESQVAWLYAADAVRSGGTAFSATHERHTFFGHKDVAPQANRAFMTRMRERAQRCYRAVPAVVDWTGVRQVMDIGGGDGYLLGRILEHAPAARGLLLERPATRALLGETAANERWEVASGDFFTELPGGSDVHVLASVLHDWEDADAVTILRHSRAALVPGGRLLVVEMVLPPAGVWHPAVWSDLGMMVLTGGRERSREEYATLFAEAGYALTGVIEVPDSPFSVLSAR